MKKFLKFLVSRAFFIAFFMLLQILALIAMLLRFSAYFVYFYAFSALVSVAIILYIINGRSNPAYKLAWVIPILVVPIFGGLLYLLFGNVFISKTQRENGIKIKKKMHYFRSDDALLEMERKNPAAANQSRYIAAHSYISPCKGTVTEYLPLGERMFERIKEELEKAERYIFMEYFIIREGVMWGDILEILERKAAQGLDIRVVYDDVGCIFTLPYKYDKFLESKGIRCHVFNPFVPVLTSRFNNRNHRKILVIDGHTGFTGGINLSDEYINVIEKHGHWKDTGICVKGKAAWGMTLAFLSMWDQMRGEDKPYEAYLPVSDMSHFAGEAGYVQPFFDSPMDGEPVGETIYLNLIYKAERYVYINTPYLILDNEMTIALTAAAKCGVDVRIVTPHIADKWYVHAVSRAYYEQLLEAGVKIYEYTPGFIHAKSIVVDGIYGVVGTVNLDFRSLYLHFECGVWLYEAACIADMLEDFEATLTVCTPMRLEECRNQPGFRRLGRAVLRVFAPLM